MTQGFNVPGLPEGLELVRIGEARDGDYRYKNGSIERIPKDCMVSDSVVVQPASGWMIVIETSIKGGAYLAIAKKCDRATRVVARFDVLNSIDLKRLLAAVQELPAFVDISIGVSDVQRVERPGPQ